MKSNKIVFFLLLLFLSSLATASKLDVVDSEAGMEIITSSGRLPKRGMPEKYIRVKVTAYYKPQPKQKKFITGSYRREIRFNGLDKTSTGKFVCIGYAAADPRIFPFGSILEVPDHGRIIVEDTGGRIKGKRLDIFVGEGDTGREKAMEWGKRMLRVKILRLGRRTA